MRWHVPSYKSMATEDKDQAEEEESNDGHEDNGYLIEEI